MTVVEIKFDAMMKKNKRTSGRDIFFLLARFVSQHCKITFPKIARNVLKH
jgi:hypothetical protein